MKIVSAASFVMLFLSATAQAHPVQQPTPPKGYCIFADSLYSPGSFLCVAENVVIQCNDTGTTWRPAEKTPNCKGPNNLDK